MGQKQSALRAAFPHTIPVLTGFLFLGFAYGILMSDKGYGVGWTVLFSLLVFAGSGQYMAITFLTTAFNPIYALLMTLMVNARHLFYGISLLERYRTMGAFKPYLIFGLCDETFSIACSTRPPEDVDAPLFYFFVTALDHSYWILGSFLGALVGSTLTLNTNGLDFVLTALFVVIFVDQWKKRHDHKPALVGLGCSLATLLMFGAEHFIIPAMIAILAALSAMRSLYKIQRSGKEDLT